NPRKNKPGFGGRREVEDSIGRAGVARSSGESGGPSALQEADDEHHHRDHQEQMNEPARDVEGEVAAEPENDEDDDENGQQVHWVSCSPVRWCISRGTAALDNLRIPAPWGKRIGSAAFMRAIPALEGAACPSSRPADVRWPTARCS